MSRLAAKSWAALAATALFSACSGGSCTVFGTHEPPAKPRPKEPEKSETEAPVRLRDFLFPRQSCSVTLRRSDTRATVTRDYSVTRTSAGETIRVTLQPPGKVETYTVDAAGIHGPVSYAATAKRLDLLNPSQRIVGVKDRLPGPKGELFPCLTTLARRDKEKVFRTYRTWCRGVGLARVDTTVGRDRIYTEIAATTCPSD